MTPTQIAVALVLSVMPPVDGEAPALPTVPEAAAIARVAYNEASGQDFMCKALVVQAILNRWAHIDGPIWEVTRAPFQFANQRPKVENVIDHQALIESAEAAVLVYAGVVHVPPKFASVDHFHADYIPKPSDWGPRVKPVGNHCGMVFYQEEAK